MDEKTLLITEEDGTYRIQNNGIAEFALIGILECFLFDLKSANRKAVNLQREEPLAKPPAEPPAESSDIDRRSLEKPDESAQTLTETEVKETTDSAVVENPKDAAPVEPKREATQPAAAPDIRTRIGNAVKAIRGLGAQIEEADLSELTEEELQSELEELTSQYKRLKSSKSAGK